MAQHGVDGVIEAYRQALHALVNGDPAAVVALFSRRDDVTLANPLGPPRRGWADVEETIEEAAAHFTSGSVLIEEVSRYATAELAYVVEIERTQVQLAGSHDIVPITLRATMIFRREDGSWKVVHRHADPITTARSIDTAVEG
jgi:ketosteroid isomerase-like protein